MNQFSAEIPDNRRAYLRWEYINFFCPAAKDAQERGVNEATGSVMHGIMEMRKQTSQKKFKQILSNCTGMVNPGELVAIMGPSGSGKTSLLNIIACRLSVSKKSYFTGKLKCNSRTLNKDNFGIFGAYVQQDDILIETMTPRELFSFAVQMKGGDSVQEVVDSKVNDMIKKLRLTGCQNTMVGGITMKGLSGGEKKRASIGYELITNPSLFLLDEPTSGLDSQTAKEICQFLKDETERGMTILCTIHQPSSEVFQTFDRVIILASGHTVYNSKTTMAQILSFYTQINIDYNKFKYSNPADTLLKLANAPKNINSHLSIPFLENICMRDYMALSHKSEKDQFDGSILSGED